MFRTRRLTLFVTLALALALTACGTSDGESAKDTTSSSTTEAASETTSTEADTSTTEAGTTDAGAEVSADDAVEICAALQALSQFDAQSQTIVASGDWAAIQQFYVEQSQAVLDAYDQAIATGSAFSEELTELRAVTAPTADLAASSTSLTDFGGKLAAMPGLVEAGQAALTLDAFAQETCGFSVGGA